MLITESLLLASLAGVLSVYLAWRVPDILYQFVAKRPPDFPLPPDWRIFAYIAAVVFATGCLCGIAPALESLKVDLAASLKGHAGGFAGLAGAMGSTGLQRLLVGAQVSLSLVMLVVLVLCAGRIGWEIRRRWHVYTTPVSRGAAGETLALQAFTHGNSCLAAGQFADASAAFHRAHEINPKHPMSPANSLKWNGGSTRPASRRSATQQPDPPCASHRRWLHGSRPCGRQWLLGARKQSLTSAGTAGESSS